MSAILIFTPQTFHNWVKNFDILFAVIFFRQNFIRIYWKYAKLFSFVPNKKVLFSMKIREISQYHAMHKFENCVNTIIVMTTVISRAFQSHKKFEIFPIKY